MHGGAFRCRGAPYSLELVVRNGAALRFWRAGAWML
jgi:hypothetical protein